MNPTASEIDLDLWMPQVVQNVFELMLTLPVCISDRPTPMPDERVSGTISIVGDRVNGAVYLHFPEPLARHATELMLGLSTADEADTASVNDVISELSNMVGGGLKSLMCDAGWDCAMSTPAILRGPACTFELEADTRTKLMNFSAGAETLVVEVHLKVN